MPEKLDLDRIEASTKGRGTWPSLVRNLIARIRELEAAASTNAEDKRDAERYRWLRSDDIEVLPGQHEITVVKHRLPFTEDSDETLIESTLDEAIDAAIEDARGNSDKGER